MLRDYCYLEDVGRKVGEWGDEIVRGGYGMENSGRGKDIRGRGGRGRGAPNGRRKAGAGRSKRDILKAYLETLDIDVDLLPNGMERRNLNQSTFDQKSKSPLLTIEFKLYPPTTATSASSPPPPSHTVLSHRNQLTATLLTALQRHISWTPSKTQKLKEAALPDWLPPLVNPHPDDPEGFNPPHCYIYAHVDVPQAIYPGVVPTTTKGTYYHKLDPALNLSELLRNTHFVEFPTIHVFDPDASSFQGTVVDKAGSIARFSEDERDGERAVKRRKLSQNAGRKAIAGLVGGYGSESGSQSEEDTEINKTNGLVMLGGYSGSDDDEKVRSGTEAYHMEDESRALDDVDSSSDVEDTPLDPVVLLELVKQAQGAADEDAVDWGDEWDVEAEESQSR
ncbi:hypothetical protein HYDPIDRAFT_23441 [Hydnomerulius pinastri MD-312]|nr:hypothetical protein HYDPIDRAFT_23441 [Hydnomerulius pinastri MD-312]